MGSVKDIKDSKKFCDDVFAGLSGVKGKLLELLDMSRSTGAGNEIIGMYERHLSELIDEVDWKLQILSHSCPYDWQGSAEFEADVQVNEGERSRDDEFSPGYLGG